MPRTRKQLVITKNEDPEDKDFGMDIRTYVDVPFTAEEEAQRDAEEAAHAASLLVKVPVDKDAAIDAMLEWCAAQPSAPQIVKDWNK
jgi:hypothetical protein